MVCEWFDAAIFFEKDTDYAGGVKETLPAGPAVMEPLMPQSRISAAQKYINTPVASGDRAGRTGQHAKRILPRA